MADKTNSDKQRVTSELADQLLGSLRTLRETDAANYPPSLAELAKYSGCKASKITILQATRLRSFNQSAILARSGLLESPIALMEDLVQLAAATGTLQFALSHCSRNKTKAHTLAKLASVLTNRAGGELRKQFRRFVEHRLQEHRLPQDVGCIVASGGRQNLFRLDDLEPSTWRDAIRSTLNPHSQDASPTPTAGSSQPAQTVDFPAVFESVFTRLDRSQGGYNFVSLEQLRKAFPTFSRAEFDAELRKLRLARRYRLSGAENRSDVSPQQREAGINEAGSLLLYAQRIGS